MRRVWQAAEQQGFPESVRKKLEKVSAARFYEAWEAGARGNDHPDLQSCLLTAFAEEHPEVREGAEARIYTLRENEFVDLVINSTRSGDWAYHSETDTWTHLNARDLEPAARQLWQVDMDVRARHPRRGDARRVAIDWMRERRGHATAGVSHERRKLYLRHAIGRESDGRGEGVRGFSTRRGGGGVNLMLELVDEAYDRGEIDGLTELPPDFRAVVLMLEAGDSETAGAADETLAGGPHETRMLMNRLVQGPGEKDGSGLAST